MDGCWEVKVEGKGTREWGLLGFLVLGGCLVFFGFACGLWVMLLAGFGKDEVREGMQWGGVQGVNVVGGLLRATTSKTGR